MAFTSDVPLGGLNGSNLVYPMNLRLNISVNIPLTTSLFFISLMLTFLGWKHAPPWNHFAKERRLWYISPHLNKKSSRTHPSSLNLRLQYPLLSCVLNIVIKWYKRIKWYVLIFSLLAPFFRGNTGIEQLEASQSSGRYFSWRDCKNWMFKRCFWFDEMDDIMFACSFSFSGSLALRFKWKQICQVVS